VPDVTIQFPNKRGIAVATQVGPIPTRGLKPRVPAPIPGPLQKYRLASLSISRRTFFTVLPDWNSNRKHRFAWMNICKPCRAGFRRGHCLRRPTNFRDDTAGPSCPAVGHPVQIQPLAKARGTPALPQIDAATGGEGTPWRHRAVGQRESPEAGGMPVPATHTDAPVLPFLRDHPGFTRRFGERTGKKYPSTVRTNRRPFFFLPVLYREF